MSRYFMIQSWVGSHENEPDYNGQQCGERNVRSSEVVPLYDQFGRANVQAFSDEAIAARNNIKKASTVNVKDRILPQFKRLQTLRTQMIDLEKEYKTTDMTCEEYSILRDVIVFKIERAEVLYKKAISVRPKSAESEEDSDEFAYSSVSTPSDNNGHRESYSSPVGVSFIDELSETNSLKSFLKMSCKLVRGLVRFYSVTKRYIKTLSEV